MKIACCQFDPKLGAVESNMALVDDLLKDYKPGDIEVLVLPEMAFTGYVFKGIEEIKPYLEDSKTGPTVNWSKTQAKRLSCFVIVGYPQIEGDQYYNSLCCVDPQGELVETYQKSFLYETDERWAIEGPGFVSVKIDKLGKIGFGICMDINPYQFKSDFFEHEFANYHLEQETEIMICCMAWLKSETEEKGLLNYWALRLLPLYNKIKEGKHAYFIACNRTGLERGKQFAGTSCALDISRESITILEHMNHDTTGVMITDIL
ncbi:unnamed protein product [Rhizopus stolonifer]